MQQSDNIMEAYLALPPSERESVKALLDDDIKDRLLQRELKVNQDKAQENQDKYRLQQIKKTYSRKFARGLIDVSMGADKLTSHMSDLIQETINDQLGQETISGATIL